MATSAHLLLRGRLQLQPGLHWSPQVHGAHRNPHLPNGVVTGEAVEVIHSHDQHPAPQLHVGDLGGEGDGENKSGEEEEEVEYSTFQ